jgi:hypothetical protein
MAATSERQRCAILETNQKTLFNGAVSEGTLQKGKNSRKIVFQKSWKSICKKNQIPH